MNNDGWGFTGAGTSDDRLAGMDLQHNRQTRTVDELQGPVQKVIQPRESGGPMKHQNLKDRLDESLGAMHGAESHHKQSMADRRHESEGTSHHHKPHHKSHMHHHLEEEKSRHEEAMEHHHDHLEKHHGRHYDSQHGHDTYKY